MFMNFFEYVWMFVGGGNLGFFVILGGMIGGWNRFFRLKYLINMVIFVF